MKQYLVKKITVREDGTISTRSSHKEILNKKCFVRSVLNQPCLIQRTDKDGFYLTDIACGIFTDETERRLVIATKEHLYYLEETV